MNNKDGTTNSTIDFFKIKSAINSNINNYYYIIVTSQRIGLCVLLLPITHPPPWRKRITGSVSFSEPMGRVIVRLTLPPARVGITFSSSRTAGISSLLRSKRSNSRVTWGGCWVISNSGRSFTNFSRKGSSCTGIMNEEKRKKQDETTLS